MYVGRNEECVVLIEKQTSQVLCSKGQAAVFLSCDQISAVCVFVCWQLEVHLFCFHFLFSEDLKPRPYIDYKNGLGCISIVR